ncbi:MAG TPA: hypothetical protein GXX50_03540 [Firmicutes bacterium]|nr:hypothetical protein [Bacillota bacterium]
MLEQPPGVEDFARINSTYLTLQDMLLPATSRLPLCAEPPAWWWKA